MTGLFCLLGGWSSWCLGWHLGGGGGGERSEVVIISIKGKPVLQTICQSIPSSDYLQAIIFFKKKPSLTTGDYYLSDNPKCIIERLGS